MEVARMFRNFSGLRYFTLYRATATASASDDVSRKMFSCLDRLASSRYDELCLWIGHLSTPLYCVSSFCRLQLRDTVQSFPCITLFFSKDAFLDLRFIFFS